MPFDYGLRLNNRQRIANARAKPLEANKNQSVGGAKSLFLRSGSSQNVYLLPQRPNFHPERCPRPTQVCDHPNNEPDKISHPVTASPDSRSTASQIEFATGTGARRRGWGEPGIQNCVVDKGERCSSRDGRQWCTGSRAQRKPDPVHRSRACLGGSSPRRSI
jgi:hypothetical protein